MISQIVPKLFWHQIRGEAGELGLISQAMFIEVLFGKYCSQAALRSANKRSTIPLHYAIIK